MKLNSSESKSIKFYLKHNIYKRELSQGNNEEDNGDNQVVEIANDDDAKMEEEEECKISHRMFLDESEIFTFARRLTFSPEGSLLIIPCGIYKSEETKDEMTYCCYGFTRNNLSEPAFILPSEGSCPLGIRFSPLLYKREETDDPFIDLPYIMVFAIATQNSVVIYTTRSLLPYAVITNIHYSELTDLAWSNNRLLVSSRDGYITHVIFDEEELGVSLTKDEMPESIRPLFDYMDLKDNPRVFNSGAELNGNDDTDAKRHQEPVSITPKFTSRLNRTSA